MKEILFISNFMGNGGAARVITVLAKQFLRKGYKVSVCSFPYLHGEYSKLEGVNYINLLPKSTKGVIYKIERIKLLRQEIKKHKNAVVISFEYFLNMQVILAAIGLKNILLVSERMDPAISGGKKFTIKHLRDFLYRFCDKVVVQTPDAKAYFPDYLQDKTIVIINPIKDDLPNRWEGERNYEIVNFCRVEKQKNLPLLIDAFAEFKKDYSQYSLAIYGDGNEKENIINYIKDKGLEASVFVHGARENIHEQIRKDAMFVSTSDYEGMSNSMLEAMAIGLPTICTDCPCGGARMIIQNGENGILVPVNDMVAVSEAMGKIAEDNELMEKLSANGVKLRTRIAAEKICDEWISAIEN